MITSGGTFTLATLQRLPATNVAALLDCRCIWLCGVVRGHITIHFHFELVSVV